MKTSPEIIEITQRIMQNGDLLTQDEMETRIKIELTRKHGSKKASEIIAEDAKNKEIGFQNSLKREQAYGKILSLQRFSDTFVVRHDANKIPMSYIENIGQSEIEANNHINEFLGKADKK
jgi:hypothetical protein